MSKTKSIFKYTVLYKIRRRFVLSNNKALKRVINDLIVDQGNFTYLQQIFSGFSNKNLIDLCCK